MSSTTAPSAARPRVFVARRIPEVGLEPILAACDAVVWSAELPPSRPELLAAVDGCVGVLTLLTDRVDEEFLDRAGPGLRVVSNYAVGYDNIDVGPVPCAGSPSATRPAS